MTALLVAGLPATASGETLAGNDEITGATPISVPGAVDQDMSGATAAGDPQPCWQGEYTVWFKAVAPETGVLRTTASASFIDPGGEGQGDLAAVLAVFTGEPGALVEQGCWTPRFEERGQVDAPVQAGDVVYIVTGALETSNPHTTVSLDVGYVRARDVTVDGVATIGSDGAVTVRGTMRCDVDLTAQVSLTLRQPSREPLAGEALVGCSPQGVSTWSLSLPATEGAAAAHPGRAVVEGAVTAVGDSESVPVSASVLLRPEHSTER